MIMDARSGAVFERANRVAGDPVLRAKLGVLYAAPQLYCAMAGIDVPDCMCPPWVPTSDGVKAKGVIVIRCDEGGPGPAGTAVALCRLCGLYA